MYEVDACYLGHTCKIPNSKIPPIYKFFLCWVQLYLSVVVCSDLHETGEKVKRLPGELCRSHIYPIPHENQQLFMTPLVII